MFDGTRNLTSTGFFAGQFAGGGGHVGSFLRLGLRAVVLSPVTPPMFLRCLAVLIVYFQTVHIEFITECLH